MTRAAQTALRQTVLITGASAGLGVEFARLAAAAGYDLVLVARRDDRLRALAADLSARHGVAATVITADLGTLDAPFELVRQLTDRGLSVAFLINNAGFGLFGTVADLPLDRQLEMIHVNTTSLTALTRLLLPAMIERRSGRILQVASTAGFVPGPLMAVYYATKAYVVSFSLALADELRDTGVTVTTLCPGPTRTEFQAAAQMPRSRLVSRMPYQSAAHVADVGFRAMMRGRRLVFPGPVSWLSAQAVRFTSRRFMASVVRRLHEPKSV